MNHNQLAEKFGRQEFICPICGSGAFGSSNCHDDVMTRHCHGRYCNFKWLSLDDDRYMHMVITIRLKEFKDL